MVTMSCLCYLNPSPSLIHLFSHFCTHLMLQNKVGTLELDPCTLIWRGLYCQIVTKQVFRVFSAHIYLCIVVYVKNSIASIAKQIWE